LTLITSLVTLLGILVSGRYEMAIMLPETNKDAKQVVFLTIMLSVVLSSFFLIIFLIFGQQIADLLNNHDAGPYLFIVPLIALLYGITQAYTHWIIRQRQFASMASARVAQSLATSGVSLGSAYAAIPFNGLVFGNLIGQLTQFVYTFLRIKKKPELSISFAEASSTGMKQMASKYSDFPKINSMQALVDVLQSTGVVFLISSLYGGLITGFYGFTIRFYRHLQI
jgi:hypothetical protein